MKKWAEDQIKRDQEDVKELMKYRAAAWERGDRHEYNRLTGYIREINESIQALESYGRDQGKKFFYNPYTEMYCVVGETYASDSLDDLEAVCGEMEEIEMPDYITEDYDGVVW